MKQVFLILLAFIGASLNTYSQTDTIKARYNGVDYLQHIKLDYPQYALEMEIFGDVIFKFHINKSGCLDSLIIISSPHEILSKEVKRTFSSLKCGWIPYNSWILDKINFRLQ